MFNLPGILSQDAGTISYKDLVLGDNPLIFLTIENGNLIVNDSFSYESGYPVVAGTFNIGDSIVNGLSQSLENTSSSSSNNTGTCFHLATSTALALANLNTTGSTELWVKYSSTVVSRPISLHDSTYVFVSSTLGSQTIRVANTTIADGTFALSYSTGVVYHLVHTWDGTTTKYYRNAQLIHTSTYSGSKSYNASNLYLGSGRLRVGNQTVRGLMQAPALYNYALSEQQIINHYNSGLIVI